MFSFFLTNSKKDHSVHQDQNFAVIASMRNCHKFDPNLHTIQPNSSQHSIHRNSSHHHTKSCPCKTCQWDTSVQSPEFLSLSLISGFQDLINQFSKFFQCTNLWHLWNLWILSCFSICCPYYSLCHHSWTMTRSVCCQITACRCLRVHCSLEENMLHRT